MRTLRFLLAEYRAQLRWLLIGLSALLAGALCQAVLPVFIRLAVDASSPQGFSSDTGLAHRMAVLLTPAQPAANMGFVTIALAMALGTAAVMAVFTFLKRYDLVRLSRRTEYTLKRRMFEHLQTLPAAYRDNTRSGAVMSLMTSDIEAVRMMIGPAVMYLGGTVVTFPVALVVMWSLNPTLTLLALLPLAGLTAATLWFNPRVRRYSTRSQEDLAELSARAQENVAGARVVKAFSREDYEVAELERLGRNNLRNKLGAARNQAMYQACIWGFSGLGVLILLYFGAKEVAAHRFSNGDFAAFVLYNLNLYWPMIALGWVVMMFVRAEASLKRINELLEQPADPSCTGGSHAAGSLRGEVVFDNVGLRHPGHEHWALSGVSFRVVPGHTLALVGPVGSGKSTVANLLLRLLAPSEGSITVDGQPLQDLDPAVLRAGIGYVPQDSFLFSDTIAGNVALALPEDAPDRDALVRRNAGVAELEAEVQAFPNQYDTLLGERGVNLSGGQKQRVAIARALARQPRILVLDDCLSAVDTATEERILRNLKNALQGVTVILIAQRVSTVQHADEILVLDDGRVIERGTDATLRAAGGFYADLARRQELAAQLAD
ncbi:MAG: ABC transporter ATP-binding protein [Planctomycetes bacterium]|nr:ABC transporter ATP-binding protein [Planctomycetota bacterium]